MTAFWGLVLYLCIGWLMLNVWIVIDDPPEEWGKSWATDVNFAVLVIVLWPAAVLLFLLGTIMIASIYILGRE